MKIGIIGHGADKFTEQSECTAKELIKTILLNAKKELENKPFIPKNASDIYNFGAMYLVSGHSPVGGVDLYAEEIAKKLHFSLDLKIPKQKQWDAEYGFKQRNLDIAKSSDVLHVILVDKYPKDYKGMRFPVCYHCLKAKVPETLPVHIKSGACWTAIKARELNKEVIYHVIKNE